jgi:ferredoxin
MTIFFFTSTGNSLAVAKRIGGEDAKLVSIPQIIDEPTIEHSDEVIGIVFPIYGFAMPKMCRLFIAKAKLTADYIFTIGTYGNMPGACMRNMQRSAAGHGIRIDYANSLLMFDNYLPLFEAKYELEVRMPTKDTEANLERIVADIVARAKREDNPGIGTRAMTTVIQAGEKVFVNSRQAKNYIINDKCTKCATCVKVCPAGNIEVGEKVEFGDKCEWCLGCVHLCPQNALHLKNEKSGERWRNPDISLAEIIRANDRAKES